MAKHPLRMNGSGSIRHENRTGNGKDNHCSRTNRCEEVYEAHTGTPRSRSGETQAHIWQIQFVNQIDHRTQRNKWSVSNPSISSDQYDQFSAWTKTVRKSRQLEISWITMRFISLNLRHSYSVQDKFRWTLSIYCIYDKCNFTTGISEWTKKVPKKKYMS